ncbi:MAG: type II toxin-antitoxin system VapC family toxin [Chitinophagaceae bacterium]|jgi:tRNA(fMet)-specific endonuclease VapC|nr:type II toxin-antitoxin system VapC family toxin [Chitinophagaceae bacterium]
MAKEGLVLCDSNIMIDVYRGQEAIIKQVAALGKDRFVISAVSAAEVLFGARNKSELQKIKKDIANIQVLEVNEEISSLFVQLVSDYTLSHKLAIPDAIIAATALTYKLPLFTHNQKDFRFITGIKFYKP